jgi:hypothetical protein
VDLDPLQLGESVPFVVSPGRETKRLVVIERDAQVAYGEDRGNPLPPPPWSGWTVGGHAWRVPGGAGVSKN